MCFKGKCSSYIQIQELTQHVNHSLIIRPAALATELGVSTTTLWRWRHQGILPQPINLGPRLVGWERAKINDWVQSQKFGEET